jgi:anti-anti-sigma factor
MGVRVPRLRHIKRLAAHIRFAEVEELGGVHVIRLHGEHDLSTVHDFRKRLDGAGAASVVIDLGTVEFIDSSVIGVVLAMAESSGETSLVLPSEGHVAGVLQMVAIGEALPTYRTVADAVAAADASS